jgi:hypothetical protein
MAETLTGCLHEYTSTGSSVHRYLQAMIYVICCNVRDGVLQIVTRTRCSMQYHHLGVFVCEISADLWLVLGKSVYVPF